MNSGTRRRSILGGLLAMVLTTGTVTGHAAADPAPVAAEKVRKVGRTTDQNLGTGGQCTYGAFAKFHRATGLWPLIRGDAAEWNESAARNGWSVVPKPQRRAVVVFERGVQGASETYGHVAWVESVRGARITITEMNGAAGEWGWSRRTVSHGQGMSYILAP
ncbi:MAG TPA: CHAP domain-containing protein [Actinophytocola sp.]|nr:CHAP domain-containing protein [Actinophytocola sp.]